MEEKEQGQSFFKDQFKARFDEHEDVKPRLEAKIVKAPECELPASEAGRANTSKAEAQKAKELILPGSANKPERSKEELLSIAGDPHAGEHEWLEALNDLDKHQVKAKRTRPWQAAAISVTLVGALGLLAYLSCTWMHVTPQTVPSANQEDGINYQPYMAAMEQKIKEYWKPPKNYGRVIVHFKLHKNGEISNLGFEQMMGYSPSDVAAVKAIEDASTFPPLPKGAPESVDIRFTFDYRDVPDKVRSL